MTWNIAYGIACLTSFTIAGFFMMSEHYNYDHAFHFLILGFVLHICAKLEED